MHSLFLIPLLMGGILFALPAAAEDHSRTIVIKNHRFMPAEIEIPADTKIKLIIDNQDPTPEEFESHDLNREKIIAGNSKGIVFVGPLQAGTYTFFGEFNPAAAQGTLVVK